jgi:predicted transposase/invertase (TIGR01784 family)
LFGLKTVVEEQIPLSRRKEVTEMVYSRADRLLDEGAKRGREEGIEVEQGIEQGIEQGTEPARTTIAITMLNDNQPIDTIIKYTGLSKEEIEQLTESVNSST